jgi:hypothetical protein
MQDIKCNKCGVMLKPYWLKNGTCNGCLNPDLIVKAESVMKAKLKKFVLKHFNLNDEDMTHLDYILDLMVKELEANYEDEAVSEYVLYDMFDEKYCEVLEELQ